jgi:uncharacterized membrane protein YgcG
MRPIRVGSNPRRHRLIGVVVALIMVAIGALGPAAAAHATAPVDLGSAYVVDKAGVLSKSEQSHVQSAIDHLYSATKTQLYVVFVPTFTDPADHTAWGTDVLQKNQIDTDGILLAVSVNGRNYDVQQTTTSGSDLSSSDVQTAVNDSLLPKLKSGDWNGAAIAFANGLTETQAAPNLTWLWIALIVVVLAVVIALVVLRTRRRNASRRRVAAQEEQLLNLERRAKGALVTIDDELRTAEQEIAFATAQFGEQAVEPFQAALDDARAQVRKAFTFQQQLDDEIPDTAEQRASWCQQIIEICERSHAALDAQTESFDKLRGLEDNVDQASAELLRSVSQAELSLAPAEAALSDLRRSYTGKTLGTVEGNVDQARQVLSYATERAGAAATAVADGDKGAAVIAVRDAQHALAQVAQLTGAVTRAHESFAEIVSRVDALRIDLQADLAAAESLGNAGPDIASAVARVRAALSQTTDPGDPISSLDRLTQANQAIDQALQDARAASEQNDRASRALEAAIRDARSRVTQAREYISLRRGGVGPAARTRLSEAERALDDAVALATTDPQQAIQAARAAEQYAAAAINEADNDMGGWPGPGGGGNGAQLGGLVTGLVLGGLFGGRGGGGFGGGGFGGGGFGGGGFGGDGGFSGGGGFGGGDGGGGGGGGFSGGGRF